MKPAIFNTDMVRAILDDRKTNTRRPFSKYIKKVIKYAYELGEIGSNGVDQPFSDGDIKYLIDFAPYKKGDIIYVRETWCIGSLDGDTSGHREYWCIRQNNLSKTVFYKADCNDDSGYCDSDHLVKWKPSIHMSKEYARLFLRVKDVRIERLNEISEEDAIAEGVLRISEDDGIWYPDYKQWGRLYKYAKLSFHTLWEFIYGNGSFNDDYVWVIELEKISKKEAING